jgi:hypothetical protein
VTWQAEAEKFVNEPTVLVEIELDSGTKRLAVDFVRPESSAPFAGRILSLPNITNSIGDLNRTYETADIEIIVADPDRDLRQAMLDEGLKNRSLTVKIPFPDEDLADALIVFSGRIYNYKPLDGLRFSISAEQYVKNFLETYPDKRITATDYPNAAEGMIGLIIPIVWGTVSSASGPLKAFMVDTTVDAEKHLVGLQHGSVLDVTNVRVNGTLKTVVTDYTITNQTIDGKVHTLIAWEAGVNPTDADLVTCDAEFLNPSLMVARGPVEAFVFFAVKFCGYVLEDFDAPSYAAAIAEETTRGYTLDGIMAEEKTLSAWKDEISNEFELDIWYDTATGLIKFQYLGGDLDLETVPHFYDYKDILGYTPNQRVDLIANWCRPGYNYDFAMQNFKNYHFYEDAASQTLHAGVYKLNPTLYFVRSAATAYDLAGRKIIRQRNPIAFEKFALPLKAFSLSLGSIVRMTHFDGPGPAGYLGAFFQLRRMELDLDNFVLYGEFEEVSVFYGEEFVLGDEDVLTEYWTDSGADHHYGYLCDEDTGEFSNGDEGKSMNDE